MESTVRTEVPSDNRFAKPLKQQVADFWGAASCGEAYAVGPDTTARLEAQAEARYELEPYLKPFARFEDGRGKDVLQIGVGMGSDHLEWARSMPRSLTGIDLTQRAIEVTRTRFNLYDLTSDLQVADAEELPFEDNCFDRVYSWGVLHHSPDTAKAVAEVHRVLRPGGVARVMVYHTWSLTGLMLWTRYGPLAGKPFRSLGDIINQHLESPGTKAYTVRQANQLFERFEAVNIAVQLSHSDLLLGEVGQGHQGLLLALARRLWPRSVIRSLGQRLGLFLLIEGRK